MNIVLSILWLLLPFQAQPAKVTFTDVTREAGISFVNKSAAEKKYILESMAGGVAMFDFDGDGLLDIYILNSYSVDEALQKKPRPKAALYKNLGNGHFKDVAAEAGIADPGWAMGVSVADYDNDGLDDLFVTCYGHCVLYHNLGKGKFEDVSARAGFQSEGFYTGAAWGDYDRDGLLDLYVAGYVDFDLKNLPKFGQGPSCKYRNVDVQCGPRGLGGSPDHLYHNNGDGTFTDVTVKAHVEDKAGFYGLGVVWTDLDDDGWPDIFVANDTTPNYAYRNNHDGTFTEMGFDLGIALDANGTEQACMGIAVGDYDRDGRLDLFVTNFADQYNTLYHKNKDGSFSDLSQASKTAAPSVPLVGWGTHFFDFDNDGWLDIFVVNGHVYPQLEGAFPGAEYPQRKLLYRNRRDGTFDEVSAQLCESCRKRRVSRGSAVGDFDEDGDLDIVVNEIDGGPSLLRNDGGNTAGNWVLVKLRGTKSNRNALGARVSLTAGGLKQVQEVGTGVSYLSSSDRRCHFGLGSVKKIDEIEIRWPNGKVDVLKDQPVNRVLSFVE